MSQTDASPALLVASIQEGDSAAEAELVERFAHGLGLMLRRLCRDPALADDLRQETLSLVIQKVRRGELRQPESLAGFIHATARNLFIADRRREARYVQADEGREAVANPGVGVGVGAGGGGEPAQLRRVLQTEEALVVRRLLGELRFDRDRQLLVRFYLSDEDKEDICRDLGIDPDRFNRVIHRARKRLRELWQRSVKRQKLFGSTT